MTLPSSASAERKRGMGWVFRTNSISDSDWTRSPVPIGPDRGFRFSRKGASAVIGSESLAGFVGSPRSKIERRVTREDLSRQSGLSAPAWSNECYDTAACEGTPDPAQPLSTIDHTVGLP
jgi:hypothetical protein